MRFQARDGQILTAMYRYDGVLAKRHIKALFWPNATWRAMEMRLSLLYHQGYLDWPSKEQWHTRPIPEPICWLGWKGAVWVASQQGLKVDWPKAITETNLRRLAQMLQQHSIRWMREPRWSQLAHDGAVVDVRLAMEQAVHELPYLALETWRVESEFRAAMDVVEFAVRDASGRLRRKKRGIVPDGYFVIADRTRKRQGLPARVRFLLEVDMGTHDTTSFFQEKILAGLAYLHSPAYNARFGANAARWLVVTTSEIRLRHLMQQAQQTVGAETFLFSTMKRVTTANALAAFIWRRADVDSPVSLLLPR